MAFDGLGENWPEMFLQHYPDNKPIYAPELITMIRNLSKNHKKK